MVEFDADVSVSSRSHSEFLKPPLITKPLSTFRRSRSLRTEPSKQHKLTLTEKKSTTNPREGWKKENRPTILATMLQALTRLFKCKGRVLHLFYCRSTTFKHYCNRSTLDIAQEPRLSLIPSRQVEPLPIVLHSTWLKTPSDWPKPCRPR